MKTENPALARFVETWLAEFGSAVEKAGGQIPQIRHTRLESDSVPEMGSAFWVRQSFAAAGENFTLWIGAPDAAWRSLVDSLAEATPEALRSACLEIVHQAQQASAGIVSESSASALRCEESETFDAPGFDPASFAIYGLELLGACVGSLWFAVELAAAGVLENYEWELPQQALALEISENSLSPSLQHLLHIKLPVSISVGRSELELKKLLGAGPGSVIVLNKETCEPVELLVGGRVIAVGEIVLVKGNYGLRIKQVVDRQDRLRMCSNA